MSSASVTIDGRITGAIDAGLLLLVGFRVDDTGASLEWMADKICGLRIFSDADGKMNRSVDDIGGGILVVSPRESGRASSMPPDRRRQFRFTSNSSRSCAPACHAWPPANSAPTCRWPWSTMVQ